MYKHINKFSLFIICLLIVQLFSPLSQVFAADTTAPTSVQFSEIVPGNYRFQWTSVTGASSYRFYNISGGQQHLVGTYLYNFATILNLEEGSYEPAFTAIVKVVESSLSESVSVVVFYSEMQEYVLLRLMM